MKIIIVENELYLAQSIAAKLSETGFEVEIYSSVKEAMQTNGDVYLLSTSLPGQNTSPLIKKFKDKIIILMVTYINNDTVSEPLKLGAKDYIVKPFMIEELLRKIHHFQEYQQLKRHTRFYQEYIEYMFQEIRNDSEEVITSTPLVIETNYQKLVDKMVLKYANEKNMLLRFVPLSSANWVEKINTCNKQSLIYVTEVHKLKKSETEQLFELLKPYDFIVSTTAPIETEIQRITLTTNDKLFDHNEILTIDDYVKFIVNSFQYKFPDTELSKKLGISRKSLWEKRKKYGLFKQK